MTKKSKVSVGLSIAAGIGVILTAKFASDDKDRYIDNIQDALFDLEEDRGLNKKEKAKVLFKSYWRTILAATLTEGCIAGAQVLDLQEIALATGAAGYFASKYKQLDEKLQELYPEEHSAVRKAINEDDAKKYTIEGTYDGRTRYFFPFLDQVVYMKPEDVSKIQWFISARLSAKGVCTTNEVADYIHQDLGYKDVHLMRENKYWELVPDGEREVTEYDFPILIPDGYEDIYIEETGENLPCKIMAFEDKDNPKSVLSNHYT